MWETELGSQHDDAMGETGCSFFCCLCRWIVADCNVIVLWLAKGLLFGGGGLQWVLKQQLGGSPSCRQKTQHRPCSYCGIQLQLGWCHSFWSLFLLAVIYFCVSVFIFVSRVNLWCVPGHSVSVCLRCYVEYFKAAFPLSLVCCNTENDTACSKQLSRTIRI